MKKTAKSKEYVVTISMVITATSAKKAGQYAIDDICKNIDPLWVGVKTPKGKQVVVKLSK